MRGVGHFSIDIVNVVDTLLTVQYTVLTVAKCTRFWYKVILEGIYTLLEGDIIVVGV